VNAHENCRFTGIVGWLVVLCLIVAGLLTWYVSREPASFFDNPQAVGAFLDPALVVRGEYVARLGYCVACHSVPGGLPFAGGLEMAIPLGMIHATNITPDKQTGIGSYSLATLIGPCGTGLHQGGVGSYPAMPYPSYAKLDDDDVRALYAFLMKSVAPVRQTNIATYIPWPLNRRWPIALWNGMFVDNSPCAAKSSQDSPWSRGAYNRSGTWTLRQCHTPRGMAFNEKALDGTGMPCLAGALLDGW
jgi:mono/diheme cytochrome c family protein